MCGIVMLMCFMQRLGQLMCFMQYWTADAFYASFCDSCYILCNNLGHPLVL